MTPLLQRLHHLGIRTKLILLFIVIKVIPLVLLALLAWEGVTRLGAEVATQTDDLSQAVQSTVGDMGKTFSQESEKALDNRAREELERLTTDTARAVAKFLYDRDQDILQAARLEPGNDVYRRFLEGRSRLVVDPGPWKLADDGKSWVPAAAPAAPGETITPANPENRQDFHYRPPETVHPQALRPLFHEITFVGLDGQEKFKVAASNLLPRDLRDISRRENTYCKAERYFPELKKLKPGDIYVSDVIGPYVKSRIIGPATPDKAKSLNLPFEPEKEGYAGRENPVGKHFDGIIRWASPVVRGGKIIGYVTLALDHSHVMSFTDNLMPTPDRYTAISDATNGNYAFMWDYQDRAIAHPRHHSIVGFDPETGEYATPWLDAGLYEDWQKSGQPLRDYLGKIPPFDHQSRDKKPAKALTAAGNVGLECRYLNFAPQCQGWYDLTRQGGSGSFLIKWTGVWKLTTAATIPYFTGHYGETPRGFGFVTIGANVDDFHKPAIETTEKMNARVAEFSRTMQQRQSAMHDLITRSMGSTALGLTLSTLLMVVVVVAIAIWLASMLTRRLTGVIGGLEQIEQGDLGFRFAKTSDDELGKLSDSLNRMADSVQESFRRLEEAKVEAEAANRMKSDFLARMSHELRTPLNGILGFAELINLESADAEIQDQAKTIYQSGEHLLSLLNDILDLAKIEAGQMRLETVPMDLPSLIEQTVDMHRGAAQTKGLDLTFELADDLPRDLPGDPTRLRQILNNLIDNALKFTAQGSVQVSGHCEGAWIKLGVRDSGPGIAPEDQARIFERFRQASTFVTRQHGGTGLGLALVKEFVELMGGQVRVESQPGAGAYFEIAIPRPQESTSAGNS